MSETSQTNPKTFKPIRVKQLRTTQAVDCPLKGMTETITAGTVGRVTTTINYEPWMRHHRVTTQDLDKDIHCILVPESSVSSWVPFLSAG